MAGHPIRIAAPAGFTSAWSPPSPDQPAQAINAALCFVEGRIIPLAGVGLGLVITTDGVPMLPRLRDWQPRAKPKAPAKEPAA